ncbi:hypothetical protein [Leptospira gomenensis]|nr:hypothetical protein [Leptospira gomenensis]
MNPFSEKSFRDEEEAALFRLVQNGDRLAIGKIVEALQAWI